MPPATRPRSRPRHDRRGGGDPEERVRRAREAQEAAYAAARQVLDRAAHQRDGAWRQAAEHNRRRALMVLGLPFVPAAALLVLGIFVAPAVAAVGAVLLLAWAGLAVAARHQAAAVPIEGLLDPAGAVAAGALAPLDAGRLEDVTEGLCAVLGLRLPRLWVLPDPVPNAASFGRSAGGASLVVTSGLVSGVDRIGLEGVLAHELSHIKRGDILSAGVAASSAGRFVDSLSGRRAGEWLAGADREVRADLAAVMVTRYPPGLIDALETGVGSGAALPGSLTAAAVAQTRRAWLMGAGPDSLSERLDVLHEL